MLTEAQMNDGDPIHEAPIHEAVNLLTGEVEAWVASADPYLPPPPKGCVWVTPLG